MKKEIKKGIIKFAILAIGMFIFFIYQVKSGFEATEKDSEYYQDTNLIFDGIIREVKPLTSYGHNFGVISIDLHNSNKEHYDPRRNLDRFLGIIINKKAELVFSAISEVKIGDSIVLNVQEYKIFRNGRLIRENIVGMPPDDSFKPFKEIIRNINL